MRNMHLLLEPSLRPARSRGSLRRAVIRQPPASCRDHLSPHLEHEGADVMPRVMRETHGPRLVGVAARNLEFVRSDGVRGWCGMLLDSDKWVGALALPLLLIVVLIAL
jgi:hypothetical protein